MNNYLVYIHRNTVNNKAYIGQTMNIKERWKPKNYRHNPHFYSAIKKYGWDKFEHIIFASDLSLEEANRIEKLLIALFDTTNREVGYNIRLGGDSGGKFPEETIRRMSAAHKGTNTGASNPRARKIEMYDLDGNFIRTWDCIKPAAEFCGVNYNAIIHCCSGTHKTSGGYVWRYVNE